MTPDSRLFKAAALIVAVTLGGTLYFRFAMGLGWVESAYQVVVTLSTVGYEKPTTELGTLDMLVITLMIPLGVGTAAYAASLFVSHIIEGELAELLHHRKMAKQIHALQNHVIVAGMGGIGRLAAKELRHAGRDVVCIDRNPDHLGEMRADAFLTLEGDATEEHVLLEAGVDRAETLVAAMANDADTVFLTLTTRFLNDRIRIVARGSDDSAERKLKRAGANVVILPSMIGGRRIAQAVVRPNVLDFVDLTTGHGEHALRLDEIRLSRQCDFAGLTIEGSNFRQRHGVIVVAVRKSDGVMRFNPSSGMVLDVGDILVALGEANNLEKLKREASA